MAELNSSYIKESRLFFFKWGIPVVSYMINICGTKL